MWDGHFQLEYVMNFIIDDYSKYCFSKTFKNIIILGIRNNVWILI